MIRDILSSPTGERAPAASTPAVAARDAGDFSTLLEQARVATPDAASIDPAQATRSQRAEEGRMAELRRSSDDADRRADESREAAREAGQRPAPRPRVERTDPTRATTNAPATAAAARSREPEPARPTGAGTEADRTSRAGRQAQPRSGDEPAAEKAAGTSQGNAEAESTSSARKADKPGRREASTEAGGDAAKAGSDKAAAALAAQDPAVEDLKAATGAALPNPAAALDASAAEQPTEGSEPDAAPVTQPHARNAAAAATLREPAAAGLARGAGGDAPVKGNDGPVRDNASTAVAGAADRKMIGADRAFGPDRLAAADPRAALPGLAAAAADKALPPGLGTAGMTPSMPSFASVMQTIATPAGAADTAPAARADIAAHVQSPEFQPQLAQQLSIFTRDGIDRAELTLTPRELGPVRVEISIVDGDARLSFAAVQAETRQAIEQSTPLLRSMLAEQGLSLGRMDVGDGQASSAQQRSGNGNPYGQGGRGSHSQTDGGNLPTGGTIAAGAGGQRRGLLDLFA